MSNELREFPMDVVLTGSTGVMLCREGFGKFHEFAEYMAGGSVCTHELVALGPILKAEILRQYPNLTTEADVTPETFEAWLEVEEVLHGTSLTLTPIPDYGRTASPLETLAEMMPDKPIVVVEVAS